MQRVIQLAGLTLLMMASTWWVGWWMVPAIAAVFGIATAKEEGGVLTAALAGATAWSLLLAYNAAVSPLGRLLDVFAAIFHFPSVTIVVVTVGYAALLAGAAAAFTRSLRRLLTPG